MKLTTKTEQLLFARWMRACQRLCAKRRKSSRELARLEDELARLEDELARLEDERDRAEAECLRLSGDLHLIDDTNRRLLAKVSELELQLSHGNPT